MIGGYDIFTVDSSHDFIGWFKKKPAKSCQEHVKKQLYQVTKIW